LSKPTHYPPFGVGFPHGVFEMEKAVALRVGVLCFARDR
jgi:hypothetical protein